MAFLRYGINTVDRRRRSSIIKWAARISRERFDLDAPDFTRTSNITGYDVTSCFPLAVIEVPKSPKMLSPMALSRILAARRFARTNQLMGFLFLFSLQTNRLWPISETNTFNRRTIEIPIDWLFDNSFALYFNYILTVKGSFPSEVRWGVLRMMRRALPRGFGGSGNALSPKVLT